MEENDMTDDDEITKDKQNSSKQNSQESASTSTSTESSECAKRLKTEDSGIYVDTGASTTSSEDVNMRSGKSEDGSTSASTSFPKGTAAKARNYRRPTDENGAGSSDDGPNPVEQETEGEGSAAATTESNNKENRWYLNRSNSDTSSDDLDRDCDDDHESVSTVLFDSESNESATSDIEIPVVLTKTTPKHKWFLVPELLRREQGASAKYKSAELFQQRCYGSLHSVQRLELMYKLEKHEGCVNSLNFHPNGSLLASGSDDLNVVIWDWPVGKALLEFDTKHRGNVFQSKFLPLSGDLHIVTCSRDGQVRLHQVSKTEGVRSTRRLGMHRGPTHKLALLKDQPHIVLSAGEDGCVISHDVRADKSAKILTVQSMDDRRIPLYSINAHPLNSHQFCVSGRDHIVRIYDQRKISPVLNTFIPGHLKKKSDVVGLHVTCAMYNYNGTEILASYNDDDIYLFDTSATGNSYVHCYQGHRNGATIKGVNFFGPKSEYIVSGSDCGNVYFWDKNTESIVQWMLADDNGVVNCLEPHPQLPIICTSGLDWDVKVWVPSHEHEPEMKNLADTVCRNHRCRLTERNHSRSDINDSQMLWMLWRHLHTTERLNRLVNDSRSSQQSARPTDTVSVESSSIDSSSEEDEDLIRPVSCSPS